MCKVFCIWYNKKLVVIATTEKKLKKQKIISDQWILHNPQYSCERLKPIIGGSTCVSLRTLMQWAPTNAFWPKIKLVKFFFAEGKIICYIELFLINININQCYAWKKYYTWKCWCHPGYSQNCCCLIWLRCNRVHFVGTSRPFG